MASVRRLFFDRLVLNLALLLGAMQLLVWHWVCVVWLRLPAPGLVLVLGTALLLVAANALAVPALRRARRKKGLAGRLARLYMNTGVATLLVGLAVAASWLIFGLAAGLLGAVGAGPSLAFEAFRTGSAALAGSVAGLLVWGFSFGQARSRGRANPPRSRSPPHRPRGADQRSAHRQSARGRAALAHGRAQQRALARPDRDHGRHLRFRSRVHRGWPLAARGAARALRRVCDSREPRHLHRNAARGRGLRRVRAGDPAAARRDRAAATVGEPLPGRCRGSGAGWSARGLELPAIETCRSGGDGPTLLLVHRPEAFPQAARLGFPLVLAGHTHGGQVALPTPGGPWNLARVVTRFTRGRYQLEGSTLYVSRGVGVGGPALRVNCSREITTLELSPV
jgi:hypothetical protein